MKPVSVRKLALAAALSAAFTVPAMAQEAGDWLSVSAAATSPPTHRKTI